MLQILLFYKQPSIIVVFRFNDTNHCFFSIIRERVVYETPILLYEL